MPDVTLTRTTTGPVRPGDRITYEMTTSSDFPDFSGFEGRLGYDPDELTLISAVIDPAFDTPGPVRIPEAGSPDEGGVQVTVGNFAGDLPGADFTVLTVTFEATAAGEAEISFTETFGPLFVSTTGGFFVRYNEPVTTSLTVEPLATPLDAQGDNATVAEDGAVEIDVLANDGDGSDLSIAGTTDGANGTVTQTAGGLTYTPEADFNGSDSFTYDVTDGDETQTVAVDVTVTPVNDAPVASDDGATVAAGGSVAIDVLANDDDVDGDDLTVTAAGDASNGRVVSTGGGVTYTPNAGFTGSDSFTYEVSDGTETDTATVDVTVTPVAPPTPAGSASVIPSTTGFVRPGDTVTFALATGADFPDFIGFESNLTYDADVLSYTGAVFNEAFVNSGLMRDRTEPADASGQTTLKNILGGTAPGVDLEGATTVVTFTFSALAAGAAEVTVSGADRGYLFSNGAGEIVLDASYTTPVTVNSLPTAADDTATVAEDGSVVVDVLDNDGDADAGDTLIVTSFGQGANGSVTSAAGGLLYTPDADFAGTDTFTYEVSDGKETVQATVTVDVTAVNDAPVALATAATVAEDGTITIDLNGLASDGDNDPLTISITQPANGSATLQDGVVTFVPAADYNGEDAFTYTVDDGTVTATASVALTVTPVNDDPVAVTDEVELDEGGSVAVAVLANDTDVDGDTLSIQDVGTASNGAVTRDGNVLTYTPTAGFSGLDSFTYTVSDGAGGTAQGKVEVTVNGVNDDPVADADAFVLAEDAAPTLLDVLGNDSDPDEGDVLSVTSVTGATNGTVEVAADGSGVVYTPNADYSGTDSFEYVVSDGKGGTATATGSITVDAVNDAPILAVGDAFEFVEGASGAVFTPTASDVDNDMLEFSLSGDDAGLFDVDRDTGAVSFKAPPAFAEGDDNVLDVTLTVSDGTMTDEQDIAVTLLKDSDGDLVADRDDNATFAFNPDQRDSNGDGFGNVIDADFDGDGFVGNLDLAFLGNALFKTGLVDGVDAAADADFDGDGDVDLEDFNAFSALYGENLQSPYSEDVLG